MISFRRSLSPSVHDRSSQNGTALPGSNHLVTAAIPGCPASLPATISPIASADLSPTTDKIHWPMSWLRFFHRREAFDRSKLKGAMWKKPFFPVMFCFFFGFLVGLMPFPSQKSIASHSDAGQQDFSLEVKGFSTHLQHQMNEDGDQSRKVEGVKGSFVENSSRTTLPSTLLAQVAIGSHLSDPGFGKLLIVVTPTYNRPFQALYLTRLSHTLKLVPPPLLWLVVEMQTQSLETATILRKTGVMYRHLVCKKNMTDIKDRGVHQRNTALAHIQQHQLDGIVYFADDDNVYSLELFEQMRLIKRFGTWPVAMLTHSKSKATLEGPVCDGHTVIGWHTNEKSKRLRRFHVDMSGFAFNSTILWDPQRWSRPTTEPIRQLDTIKEGFQETTFIEQLVEDESQMEGLPSGCSKVMVWHLHLESSDMVYPPGWTVQQSLNATRDL